MENKIEKLDDKELSSVSGGTGEIYWHWHVTYLDGNDKTVKSADGHNYATEADARAAMNAKIADLTSLGHDVWEAYNKVDSSTRKCEPGHFFVVY